MSRYLKINSKDNVAVALEPLLAGDVVEGIVMRQNVPAGHKIALTDMKEGDTVVKYGFPIGHTTKPVLRGDSLDHNSIKTNLEGRVDYKYEPYSPSTSTISKKLYFNGFRRASGETGIRNQIWIIPTVGCVNGVAETIARRLNDEKAGNMGSVDAIVAFPHNYGCSQLGDDHENTRRILADMVHHPNAGGVLIVSLGCENNQLSSFMKLVGDIDATRVKTIETQKIEGDEIEEGLKLAREIFDLCSKDVRTTVPLSELKIGLKCGGSDGLSGITANPLLGLTSDWLIAQGGTTVLTEVPEMFGAETILMNRCKDRETFEKTVALINGFKDYFLTSGQPVYENPSPGNKAGGISTLEEKSLGCVQKCGNSTVQDVLSYGEKLKSHGLNLLNAPGNDLVATTALGASGCQIVLFTTGRGTPFGSFIPTVKLSSNTPLSTRKPAWIDFNAGKIADGDSIANVFDDFISILLDIINGRPTKSESARIHEIAIWKTGITL